MERLCPFHPDEADTTWPVRIRHAELSSPVASDSTGSQLASLTWTKLRSILELEWYLTEPFMDAQDQVGARHSFGLFPGRGDAAQSMSEKMLVSHNPAKYLSPGLSSCICLA